MKSKNKNKKKKKTDNNIENNNNGFEPGYEDEKEANLREAKRRLEESKKPFNPMDFLSTKNIIIFIIWYSLYRIFLYYNFALVFILITIIALIFLNLGERKPGELSAYSVFNPNQERIYSFDNNDILIQNPFNIIDNERINNEIQHRIQIEKEIKEELNRKVKSDTKNELKKEFLKTKAEYSLNSNCKCGSGKKYKNCCLKKMK